MQSPISLLVINAAIFLSAESITMCDSTKKTAELERVL